MCGAQVAAAAVPTGTSKAPATMSPARLARALVSIFCLSLVWRRQQDPGLARPMLHFRVLCPSFASRPARKERATYERRERQHERRPVSGMSGERAHVGRQSRGA
uniref:Uncharacterized protein n=1 Tax=Streptomyces sp. HK1 TaxID=405041 RepID=B0LTX5_9ACTN|nr:unknown [Streptomyces sp. HK1]